MLSEVEINSTPTRLRTTVPDNFHTLVGAHSLGTYDAEALDAACREMSALGFQGVFFPDIFIDQVPAGTDYNEDDLIFPEDEVIYLSRPRQQLAEIRDRVASHGLQLPVAHFLQTLPPPGEGPEWIFPWHERVLDVAAFMGIRQVTTHVGAMLGLPCERYMGRHARRWKQGGMNVTEMYDLGREVYGPEKLLPDLLLIYRRLCSAAAERGITISVETGVDEFPDISHDIDRMISFVQDVGAENLGICLDAGHCNFRHMNIKETIQKAGSLLIETHFHDNFADRDSHYPVGIGTINWRELIHEMVAAHYQGVILFEQSNHAVNAKNWGLLVQACEDEWARG